MILVIRTRTSAHTGSLTTLHKVQWSPRSRLTNSYEMFPLEAILAWGLLGHCMLLKQHEMKRQN
jgi:hypothetical protein